MYLYQKYGEYFAQASSGMEELCENELMALGAEKVRPGFRGVFFTADQKALYRILYNARLVSRVIAPLAVFEVKNEKTLYGRVKGIPWKDFISVKNTFAVFANVSESVINHSHYAGLKMKDAIADYFRGIKGIRPNVDKDDPDVWFNLHIRKNKAVVGLDLSGRSLHKRGYRLSTVEAPMQETLAAAIIRLSGWDGKVPLYDPMCGSGTLLCEALMHYSRIPSGYLRPPTGLTFLPDFDEKAWKQEIAESNEKIRPLKGGMIYGSDISQHAIMATRKNTRKLPYGEFIRLERKNFTRLDSMKNAVIVVNPPYGIRLKDIDDLQGFYKSLGDFLKNNCQGSTAYIYFGEREYIKHLGLKATFKKELKNGGLDGRLVKVAIY